MSFRDLLEQLKKLNLPSDKFVVIGSGPLGVRGVREVADLDVLVTDSLWNQLVKKYPVKDEWKVKKIVLGNSIEVVGGGSFL